MNCSFNSYLITWRLNWKNIKCAELIFGGQDKCLMWVYFDVEACDRSIGLIKITAVEFRCNVRVLTREFLNGLLVEFYAVYCYIV